MTWMWAWIWAGRRTGLRAIGMFGIGAALAACEPMSGPIDPVAGLDVVGAAADEIFVGAGDIAACDSEGDEATAAILDTLPGTVYTTGDNAYESGTAQEFGDCYGSSWGRHRDRTRPVPGNHEYYTPGARPYYEYFGAAAGERGKGYYSYDLGSWHVIALNSAIDVSATSAQYAWLAGDLAANPVACTIAYWHHPRFSTDPFLALARMDAIYRLLYDAGVDVVVTGHAHFYERFAPHDPDARPDAAYGIRQFVVGTGGRSLGAIRSAPAANSEVLDNSTYGVLLFVLRNGGYDWEFIPAAGGTFRDSGSGDCHGSPSAVEPPDENQPPIADAGPDQTLTDADDDGEESVTLDGSGSSDPDGTLVAWAWQLEGAEVASGEQPTLTLPLGIHTLTLTVTDDAGASDSDDVVVEVLAASNESPTAAFDYTCDERSCSFTDRSSDGDGSIVGWSWDFGDGSVSTEPSPEHTFGSDGTYAVTLNVTDDDGAGDSETVDVTVASAAGASITLTSSVGSPVNGRTPVTLTWSGATTGTVELHRGSRTKTLNNTGQYVDVAPAGTHVYKICEPGAAVCSNEVTVEL